MGGVSALGAGAPYPVWQRSMVQPRAAEASSLAVEVPGITGVADTPAILPELLPESRLPSELELNNASEVLVRMRIQFPGNGEEKAVIPDLPGKAVIEPKEAGEPASEPDKAEKALGTDDRECQTCANRKYADGSNDLGVSFKTPTKLSPGAAASAVRSHEMEHVFHEQANAKAEGKEIVSQSVAIKTEICPECGRAYVAGGTTTTITKSTAETALGAAA